MKVISIVIAFGILFTSPWAAHAAQGDAKRIALSTKAQAEQFRHSQLKKSKHKYLLNRDVTVYRSRQDGCNVNIASNTARSNNNVNINLRAKNITVICK